MHALLLKRNIYRLIQKSESERKGETVLAFTGSLPKWQQRLELDQARVMSLELNSGLLHGWRDPKTRLIFYCFARPLGS